MGRTVRMTQIPESTGNVPTVGAEDGNANITQRRHKLPGGQKLATVDPWGGIKTEMRAVHTDDEFQDPDLAADRKSVVRERVYSNV